MVTALYYFRSVDNGRYLICKQDDHCGLSLSDYAGDEAMFVRSTKEKLKGSCCNQVVRMKYVEDKAAKNIVQIQHPGGDWASVIGNSLDLKNLAEQAPGRWAVITGPPKLPSKYVAEMREKGYTVLTNVLPKAARSALREQFVQKAEEGMQHKKYTEFRIASTLSTSPSKVKVGTVRAAMHPIALWIMKQYLGKDGEEEDVVLSHPPSVNVIPSTESVNSSTLIRKQPDWHSDYPYKRSHFPELEWPKDLRMAVQFNICVDEFRADNAGTLFVPGSHTNGRYPPEELNQSSTNWMGCMAEAVTTNQFTAPAGAGVLYDSRIWHRSCPELNTSGDFRCALLNACHVSWVEPSRPEDRQREIGHLRKDAEAMRQLTGRELRLLEQLYCREPTPQPQGAIGALKVKVPSRPFTSTQRDDAKALLSNSKVQRPVDEEPSGPLLVCLHPGGFMPNQGAQVLGPLIKAAREKANIREHIVLSYPETYGFNAKTAESDSWSKYIDVLVEEIDRSSRHEGRPVILWSFWFAGMVALSLAHRLGQRVLKIYSNCFSIGPYVNMATDAKFANQRRMSETDDVEVFKFIARSLPKSKFLQTMLENYNDEELRIQIEKSSAIQDLIELGKRQYNSLKPAEKDLGPLSVPIFAVFSTEDDFFPPDTRNELAMCSSSNFDYAVVKKEPWTSFKEIFNFNVEDMVESAFSS